ncbi:hypothetical protein B0G80_8949 [Paraburkholderia sp. BL6669N2]|uniref:hypothetical protein n=1 Tax=Paraburkholderia sp. BL6669N2 TaxID=1938807 RepID=UPI000E23BB10|nr:hypothetical protein [Paraburkholderia sp. BL6669N2]REG52402.1 hypothetical protein B0G80_8949 [Paraburkholderia sp. BL6669N2]
MITKALARGAALVAIAGCTTGTVPFVTDPSVTQLQRMKQASDNARTTGSRAPLRAMAAEQINCERRSDTLCEELYGYRASACAQLTNTGDAAQDAASRQCAVSDYERAIALLPDPPADRDRTKLLAGLADALKTMRSQPAPGTDAAALTQRFDDTVAKLQAQPDGKTYARYFRADEQAVRAMNGRVPPAEVRPALRNARSQLTPDAGASADLSKRMGTLANSIDNFSAAKGCP